ncbi:PLP-dependent aminotransferase family protein [uncultured Agrococcus sp.]|uniref:MocR-like pyridoxine biosynthesis transcription factor PdxR n=1 Tax=uncultured Agrococcus sp. TaxID=382258 RepID=UPI0025F5B565|nr:PLP-dependent aminotransferase family protein [uncultured Agrococcus sp.]
MLPFVIDRASVVPIAAQIAAGVRGFVADGALEAGQSLPSSRRLGQQLGVARGTVVSAYDQLVSEGYLVTRAGGATRIHPDAARADGIERASSNVKEPAVAVGESSQGRHRSQCARQDARKRPDAVDLMPGRRPAPVIDDAAWREAWRKAATANRVDYSPRAAVAGLQELRLAIAEHLRLLRAMVVDPDSIIVTGGARDGLTLVLAGLEAAPVAVESPGYPGLRRVLQRRGVPVRETPVDGSGLIPAKLPRDSRAVLVTPNHLFPVGGSMPAARRMELLRHASETGMLVIEDDFDSDFRHVGAPVPTLFDLHSDAVIHVGTFSQVLTAEAGVGYVILPDDARDALLAAAEDLGPSTPAIAQRAVADFLHSGGLRRRITRRRRALIRRRDLLLQELAGLPVDMISGAHAVVRTHGAGSVPAVIERCESRGVLVGDLSAYWSGGIRESPAPDAEEGIVLQCDDTADDDLLFALRVIREALDDASVTLARCEERDGWSEGCA